MTTREKVYIRYFLPGSISVDAPEGFRKMSRQEISDWAESTLRNASDSELMGGTKTSGEPGRHLDDTPPAENVSVGGEDLYSLSSWAAFANAPSRVVGEPTPESVSGRKADVCPRCFGTRTEAAGEVFVDEGNGNSGKATKHHCPDCRMTFLLWDSPVRCPSCDGADIESKKDPNGTQREPLLYLCAKCKYSFRQPGPL